MSPRSPNESRRIKRLTFGAILQDLCGMTALDAMRKADQLDGAAAVELQAAAREPNSNRAKLRALAAVEDLETRQRTTRAA